MSDSETSQAQPERTSVTVRDRDVATQIVVELTERGIPRERVTTRDLDPGEGVQSPRATGEEDIAFTEAVGKTIGAGWLIAFLIGAAAGALGVWLLFEPPWASPLAAGITLAVAIGVGYIAAAMGFIQSALARVGEQGGEPITETRPGHAEHDVDEGSRPPTTGAPAGKQVEVIVEAATPEQARTARTVFEEHNAGPVR